ncbi:MAG: hypothetical protein JRH20_12445, partial [Deltaproteobacteria bacterium]|nr:hypothetical protein [Deltaproteobacteria bacterium]
MRLSWILAPLLLVGCATEKTVGGGNPRTLAPLLGGGHAAKVARAKPSTEAVEDYTADLGLLRQAWPNVRSELPSLLRALIARGSWTDIHHSVTTHGDVLRVRHRPAIIAETRKLVHALRARLLRPLHLQVALVEVSASTASSIFPTNPKSKIRSFDTTAFRAATGRKQARDLTRVAFTAYNGQWKSSERMKKHALLSGVNVSGGTLTPRMTTLVSGASLQAAAWRWGEDRAVLALSASFMGEAQGGVTLRQQLHRELPREKTTERRWQAHDLELSLPVRQLMEYSGKLTLDRGVWTVAGMAPRDTGRVCAVVVKVDWTPHAAQPTHISPQSGANDFVLELIPVALPSESRRPSRILDQPDFRNRQSIEVQGASLRRRARSKQAVQKKNTYNFQSMSGALTLSSTERARGDAHYQVYWSKTESSKFRPAQRTLRPRSQSVLGAMPPHLEKLKADVMKERWPAGTA